MTKPTSLAAVISVALAIGALAVNHVVHAMRPAGPATVFEQGEAEGMTWGAIAFCIVGIVLAVIGWKSVNRGEVKGRFIAIGGFVLNVLALAFIVVPMFLGHSK